MLFALACAEPAEEAAIYRLVRIDDLAEPSTTTTSGADIDSVSVTSASVEFWADEVVSYAFGSGGRSASSGAEAALGPTDSACVAGASGFVSLGGSDGGSLTLAFAVTFPSGATVSVVECAGEGAVAEPYEVWLGDGNGGWSRCMEGLGESSCEAP